MQHAPEKQFFNNRRRNRNGEKYRGNIHGRARYGGKDFGHFLLHSDTRDDISRVNIIKRHGRHDHNDRKRRCLTQRDFAKTVEPQYRHPPLLAQIQPHQEQLHNRGGNKAEDNHNGHCAARSRRGHDEARTHPLQHKIEQDKPGAGPKTRIVRAFQ